MPNDGPSMDLKTNDYRLMAKEELISELASLQMDIAYLNKQILFQDKIQKELNLHQSELKRQNRELREARSKLEESRQRYADLYDFAPCTYMELDGKGVVVDINLTGARLLDVERNNLIGKPFSLFVLKDDIEKFQVHLSLCKAGRERVSTELKLSLKKGRDTLEVQLVSILRSFSGGLFFRTAVLDVTQLRATERLLASQAQELAKSNMALEQFAFIASHDLQSPIRQLLIQLDLLESNFKPDNEKKRQLLHNIRESGRRMSQLVYDLLKYSRIREQGEELSEVDMMAIVRTIILDLQVEISERKASITFGQLPVLQNIARFHMEQLLRNLISNALKYGDGKAVEIDIRAIPRDQGWLFYVKDNGIGVKPEHREKIFDLFERIHPRAHFSGTGMGLAICRKVVTEYGGKIWVESEPGQGSTFFFTLPVRETKAPS